MAFRVASVGLSRCIGVAGGFATAGYALSHQSGPARALSAPPSVPKTVVELSLSSPSGAEGDFDHWLNAYIKQLLQLPGLHGAKVLAPEAPAVPAAAAAAARPGVAFVLGGPGAGKGTQSAMVVEKYGYVHLSAGDLLRAERASGSAQGQMIDEYIKEGRIVPVEVTVKLLHDAILADGGQRFLVDGFPRNTNNLSGWQQVVGESLAVGGVLFYDCPEDVMEERLLERGKTSGRSDDNLDSIRKRFRTYTAETQPIIAYYDHQKIVHKIDGTREVGTVWVETQQAVEAIEEELKRPAAPPADSAAAAPAAPSVVVQLWGDAAGAPSAAELAKRVAADAAARWGAGAVNVSGRALKVEASLKAYDLEALRAFD